MTQNARPQRSAISGTGHTWFAMLVALVLVLSSCSSDTAQTAETASQPDPTEAAVEDTEDSAEPAEAPEVEPTEAPAPEPTDPPPADPADEPIDDQPDEADTSDISPTDAIPVDEAIDWTMCGLVTQCGTVAVPADYDDPAAGTLDIAVNIRRTSNFEDRVGYLFVNPGGPGFSGQETVTDAEFYFDEELLDRFDLVGFDPTL